MDERRSRPISAVFVACSAVLLAAWLWAAGPASAATQTFDTPGSYDWVVPAGVTSATFDLFGGSGSDAGGATGGNGGETAATIAVTPGETLKINVGIGNPAGQVGGSGFGGGASDVRQGGSTLASRVLVAGAGGGAGGPRPPNNGSGGSGGNGGNGGGLEGASGAVGQDGTDTGLNSGGCEGQGGTQTAGGDRGDGAQGDPPGPPEGELCVGPSPNTADGTIGDGGSFGSGGGGYGGFESGGGGGGGYYGGGGGSGSTTGGGGGGGGGSSFATAAATGVTIIAGANLGDGEVTVTYQTAPPPTHTLSVTDAGIGSGSVTSSPAGIDCGASCAHAYNEGTSVTLTATVASGSSFAGWSGGGCSGTGTCTVTMSSDQAVTATFTASPSGGGGGSGGGSGGGGSGGGGSGGGGGIGAGALAPTVGSETLSPTAFAAAPSGLSALAAKRHYGSKVSYSLNETATVRFSVVEPQPGRVARGGRCVEPARANQKAPKCTRLVPIPGGFTRTGGAGANSFRFTGRLAGRKLAPGKYQLVATPNANGQVGKPTHASFQIIK